MYSRLKIRKACIYSALLAHCWRTRCCWLAGSSRGNFLVWLERAASIYSYIYIWVCVYIYTCAWERNGQRASERERSQAQARASLYLLSCALLCACVCICVCVCIMCFLIFFFLIFLSLFYIIYRASFFSWLESTIGIFFFKFCDIRLSFWHSREAFYTSIDFYEGFFCFCFQKIKQKIICQLYNTCMQKSIEFYNWRKKERKKKIIIIIFDYPSTKWFYNEYIEPSLFCAECAGVLSISLLFLLFLHSRRVSSCVAALLSVPTHTHTYTYTQSWYQ